MLKSIGWFIEKLMRQLVDWLLASELDDTEYLRFGSSNRDQNKHVLYFKEAIDS
jgi:hypothetical protein